MDWHELIVHWGSVAAAFTAIMSFLFWVWKKVVVEPNQKLEEKLQRDNNESLEKSVAPLTQSIERLNYLLEESQNDRKALHKRDKEQGVVLDDHETRITILEDWRERRKKNEKH